MKLCGAGARSSNQSAHAPGSRQPAGAVRAAVRLVRETTHLGRSVAVSLRIRGAVPVSADRPQASRAPAFERAAPLVGFVVVGICAFLWLSRLAMPFPIHGDGIRDQLLVRDCTELGRCHLFGAPTSIIGRHGAVWVDILTAVRLLGGDTTTQVALVVTFDVLAAALTFVVVWRWLHPALALPAAVLLTRAVAADQSESLLVNGSASALFDVTTAAGVLCYALSNRLRFLLVAAFAAALAVNVHAAAVTLLPALFLVAAFGRRPARAVAAAGAVFAAVWLATSGAALEANVRVLADRRWTVIVLPPVAALAALVLASRCAAAFQRLAPWARAAWVGVLLALPFAVASFWLVRVEGHWFDLRYLHPIWGPVAVFQAAIVCAPFLAFGDRLGGWAPWIPSVVALWLAIPQLSAPAPSPDALRTWALADATRIGLEAAKAGWSFEELAFRLQSRACSELLTGIAAEGPRLTGERLVEELQYQVATADSPPESVPDGSVVVPLENGRVSVLRTVRSWMRPRGIVVCRQSLDRTVPPSCQHLADRRTRVWLDRSDDGPRPPEEFSFEARAAVGMWPTDAVPPYVTRYRIPVHPRAGEAREFRLADPGVAGCRWEFVAAEGLPVEGPLPATRVRLRADRDGPGMLVVEKPFGVPSCPHREVEHSYPPCVWETQPGEPFAGLLAGDQ